MQEDNQSRIEVSIRAAHQDTTRLNSRREKFLHHHSVVGRVEVRRRNAVVILGVILTGSRMPAALAPHLGQRGVLGFD